MADYQFVEHLPDLIQPEEYASDPEGRRVRIRVQTSADGVEIVGDAMKPAAAEAVLEALGAETIDQTLCG